ncbi:MAG: apolipoprotein N-acyltransferase [Chlorobiaceae bacterium]|nr:apolipoprotein N-acyltransferase [Chlorobiaceae bacterium]
MNRNPFPAAFQSIFLPLLSGVLLGISFPTWPSVHLEPLAWVALLPLLLAVEHDECFGSFFRKTWVATLVYCVITLWWVCLATLAGGLLTIFAQSLFSTVPFILFYFFRRRAGEHLAMVSLPFLWTAWEWAYMQQDLSLGWLTLGNSQANLLWMVQYADIAGVWGVSFWVVSFNVLALMLVRERLRIGPAAAVVAAMVLMVSAPLGYAWSILGGASRHEASRSVRVAMVQPDIDPHEKWGGLGPDGTLDRLFRLTGRSLVADRADLVLWPETAIPFYIRDPENGIYMNAVRRAVEQWGVPLLTGFPDAGRRPGALASMSAAADGPAVSAGRPFAAYNASMLLHPGDGGMQVYRKMRLVPFGERVPYSEYLPWLERMSFSMSGITSWQQGKEATVMTVRGAKGGSFRIANIICYESIFPGLVSEFVSRGAQLVTLVTNDGWYGTSYGPWQHAAIGRLRCIENRRAMARCANTGVTLVYDRFGRTVSEIPWWEGSVLVAEVPIEDGLTFYTAHPDLFPKACIGIGAALMLLGLVGRKGLSGKGR